MFVILKGEGITNAAFCRVLIHTHGLVFRAFDDIILDNIGIWTRFSAQSGKYIW